VFRWCVRYSVVGRVTRDSRLATGRSLGPARIVESRRWGGGASGLRKVKRPPPIEGGKKHLEVYGGFHKQFLTKKRMWGFRALITGKGEGNLKEGWKFEHYCEQGTSSFSIKGHLGSYPILKEEKWTRKKIAERAVQIKTRIKKENAVRENP